LAAIARLPPLTPPDEHYKLAVADAMTRLRGDVVLVLDAFEELVGSESEHLLASVLRFAPDRVRVIVLTRIDPQLGQARLRMADRLVEIGVADLAFTSEEILELLGSRGVTLGPEQLARLQERTHGWVAAVRIAASSLTSLPERSLAITSMRDWNGEIDEFLGAEMFEKQSPEIQSFMMRTCIVDSVCAGLADALTGRSDSEAALLGLQQGHLLGGMTAQDGRWYRWQPMVADLLRRRLHDRSRQLESELHVAASQWFLEDGRPVEAIEHALAGSQTEAAATILGECWLDLFIGGESAVLIDLLGSFDEATLTGHPDLLVAGALMRARQDDVDSALAFAGLALARADTGASSRSGQVVTMATMVRLYAATMTGRPCEAGADTMASRLLDEPAHSGMPLTRRERVCRALLAGNLGAFEASRQLWEPAQAHLEWASAEAVKLDLPYLELSCSAHLSVRYFYAGELTRGTEEALKVLEAAATRGWRSYHGLTAAHLALAGMAVLRDDLSGALHHLADVEPIMRPIDRVSRVRTSFLRATSLCSAGRVDEASRELEHLTLLAAGGGLPEWVAVMVRTALARHEACLGRPEAGLALLHAFEWPKRGIPASVVRPYPVVLADLLLRCGRAEEARTVLAPWVVRDHGWPVQVAALVVDALAAEALGLHDVALGLVDEALEAAAPERVIQPFVASGRGVRPLLEAVLERGTAHQVFAVEVLSHMLPGKSTTIAASSLSPYYVEPLSDREVEVLRLLQGTATNEQIAQGLFISVNTLRSHMKSINRKLAASDRRDAVRRARELSIL
jgi:LuxR family maltose regulon positive regulatory protein